MIILKAERLTKIFGRGESAVRALNGVDLELERGKFTALIGSSGSGKTTLLNLLGGLETPTSGRVIVDGTDLSALNDEQLAVFRRKKVGFVFQNYNLVPTLTVLENIRFPLDLDGSTPDKDFLNQVIDLLAVREKLDYYPASLSGGQQQRVAIARAMAAKPAILLADEPTGNLDSKTSQNVAGLLKTTAAAFHQTVVMITHNLELAQLADAVLRMEDGRILP